MSRPRSFRAHAKVLDAALKLFAERGIDSTSMDSIAELSKVSKATIYKHWPDKDTLCLEVIAELLGGDEPRPAFDSGDIPADLVAVLAFAPPDKHSNMRMRIMPHLMAYAARNPSVGEACRKSIFESSRAQLRLLLDRAVGSGQLPPSLDLDVAIALLLGPMMYGHMLKRLQGRPPANLPEQTVATFWKAHAIKSTIKARPQR